MSEMANSVINVMKECMDENVHILVINNDSIKHIPEPCKNYKMVQQKNVIKQTYFIGF